MKNSREFESIEFMGLSGAGKSFHHRKVLENLQSNRNYPAYDLQRSVQSSFLTEKFNTRNSLVETLGRLRRYKYRVTRGTVKDYNKFAAENPELIQTCIEGITRRSESQFQKEYALNKMFWTFSNYQTLLDRSYQGLLFMDEGFIQKGATMFCDHQEMMGKHAEKYIERISLPDKVVWIKADKQKCLETMKGRERGFPERIKKLKQNEKKEFLDNLEKYFEIVIQVLNKRNAEIIEIENSWNDDSVSKIKEGLL